MEEINKLKRHYDEEKVLEWYKKFLSFQSVSSDPAYKDEVLACVLWLKEALDEVGFKTELWGEETTHPTLFAENLMAGPEKPTVLIYNHYDVQPPEPFELWESPPFEPTVKNGELFCRGAQDNKGQCTYVIEGIKLLLKSEGELPVNVKLCIEGEEECGSTTLAQLIREKKERLKADTLVIADLGIPEKNKPAITLGVRGIITFDVTVKGSNVDLHSGQHGGITYNPIHALVNMLAALRDREGRVTVEGFYDAVKPFNETLPPFDKESYKATFGAEATGGEKSYPPEARASVRPTLEINGISGGYSGDGFKTVIPDIAHAKISCRLVPDQEPATIAAAVKQALLQSTPEGLTCSVNIHSGGGRAVRASHNSPSVQAFSQAYEELFQKKCIYIYEGGSIPIIEQLQRAADAELIMMGLGLASDNIHAPNEHFSLDRLEKGACIIARALNLLK